MRDSYVYGEAGSLVVTVGINGKGFIMHVSFIITASELPPFTCLDPDTEELIWFGKVMVSHVAFSSSLLAEAVDYCQRAGEFCVLVERDEYLLIYTEKAPNPREGLPELLTCIRNRGGHSFSSDGII